MPYAQNGEVRLFYEIVGEGGAEGAVLLLNGAGRQSIDWDDGFCARLVALGYRVIRFDSRDTGLSSGFAGHPPGLVAAYADLRAGRRPRLAYDLADMAGDALAVLAAAGEPRAHLMGRSIGGAAAQWIAIHRPEAVRSLTLIMSNSRSVAGELTEDYLEKLESETIADEAAFVARQLRVAPVIGSPGQVDLEAVAAQARRAYGRGVHQGGVARHFGVGLAMPDLRADLAGVAAPTLVIHGALDPLIPPAFAEETAAAIPGAELTILPDMAHDGPPANWRRWADLFEAFMARLHAGRAGSATS